MAHMDPLQSAIESGWLSPLALYLVFAALTFVIIKHRKVLSPLQISSAAILSAFFINMHLNYPLHSVPFFDDSRSRHRHAYFSRHKTKSPLGLSWGLLITLARIALDFVSIHDDLDAPQRKPDGGQFA